MSGPAAAPHAVFSLRTSAFNDFLFASIGEEENGMLLTVLSALARSGVDPWDEAARLSQLSRDAAIASLTASISGLPHGPWSRSDARDIAARLIALLPAKPTVPAQQRAAPVANHLMSARMAVLLFIFFANALAFSVLRNHEPPPAVAQSASASATASPPEVPLADAK